jgi:DNA-directed RNA polymerase specialized sigma24 family protein
MPKPKPFLELIRRVRAQESAAAEQLVKEFQPDMERAIRVPLHSCGLHRVVESTDICQAVLGRFFAGMTSGRFVLEDPDQLRKLLATMARNEVLDEIRKIRAVGRDTRRTEGGSEESLRGAMDPGPTPSRIVAGRELIQELYKLLSPFERRMAEHRALGHDWATIAKDMGGNAEACRKKLSRAINRVCRQLGLQGPEEV